MDHEDEEPVKLSLCGKIKRVLFLSAVLLATIFSLATLLNCNFISLRDTPSDDNPIYEWIDTDLVDAFVLAETTTLGLTRWNPDGQGCRAYDESLSRRHISAQAGGMIGAICGLLACSFVVLEFVCCRFVCSRGMTIILLTLGLTGQFLTFFMYGSNFCWRMNGAPYQCQFEWGTALSFIATLLLLTGLMLSCGTPKSKPVILLVLERIERKSQQREENEESHRHACFCCFRKKQTEQEEPTRAPDEESHRTPLFCCFRKKSSQQVAQTNQAESHQGGPPSVEAEEVLPTPIVGQPPPLRPSPYAGVAVPIAHDDAPREPPTTRKTTYPATLVAMPPRKSPVHTRDYVNAEVIQSDLFFDTKGE